MHAAAGPSRLAVLSPWFSFSKIDERRASRGPRKPPAELLESSGRSAIRRFELQVFVPDWGGWHTVVTAASQDMLTVPSRLLRWQTGKPLRVVDADGRVVRELSPWPAETAAT